MDNGLNQYRKQVGVYIAEVVIIYSIVLASLVNLSIGQTDKELWVGLLSTAIGILLPNPRLPKKDGGGVLYSPPQ